MLKKWCEIPLTKIEKNFETKLIFSEFFGSSFGALLVHFGASFGAFFGASFDAFFGASFGAFFGAPFDAFFDAFFDAPSHAFFMQCDTRFFLLQPKTAWQLVAFAMGKS